MTPKYLTASTLVSAMGRGRDATWASLQAEQTGLAPVVMGDREFRAGEVAGVDDVALAPEYAAYDCRNNRLAELALASDGFAAAVRAAVERHGPERVGIFMATSTAGMRETEARYKHLGPDEILPADFTLDTTHRLSATTDYLRWRLGVEGPLQSISTACSSSAKVLASAARHIDAGLCDAAVVGGVDSLCRTTLFGFQALELTSSDLCRPFSPDRDGLCLGEAAALGLLERQPRQDGDIALLGYGESTDAHHMSTPHPEALGARLAMRRALTHAGVDAVQIDYVNLHGTATHFNDSTEAMALSLELGDQVPASSTKGWMGHTLGAAGMVEVLICELALREGLLPRTLNTERIEDDMHCNILLAPRTAAVRRVLSNSFGFGGNNCSLVLGYPA